MRYLLLFLPIIAWADNDLHFRGRLIYAANCIMCHNSDPKKQGSQGPDVWGSSEILLKEKVINGQYPDGYTPKRSSHAMPKLPGLKKEIHALYLYLNGIKEKK